MTIKRLIPYCLAVFFSLSGCVRDNIIESYEQDGRGQQVQISLTALTRGEDDPGYGTAKDHIVESIRIMGFDWEDGKMAFNHYAAAKDFGKPDYTVLANVWTGRYDIVIVANEEADETNLHDKLAAMTRGNSNISQLGAIYADYETVLAGDAAGTGIPMMSFIENVTIQGSPTATKIIVGSKEYADKWTLEGDHRLSRMLVRVNAAIELTAAQEGVLTDKNNIYFTNLPKKIYLLPRANMPASSSDVIAEKGFAMSVADHTDETKQAEGVKVAITERALLPESLFADPAKKDNGMRIALKLGENLAGANLYSAAGNYTVPRNTFIDVTGAVADNGVGLALFLKIENWNDVAVSADALGRKLNISDTEATILYRTTATADEYKIYFWTNQKKVYIEKMGYVGDDMGDQTGSTFEVNTIFETLSGDTNGDGSTIASAGKFDFDPSAGSGCITLKPKKDTGANVGRIVLNAGGLRKEILTTTVCYGGTPTAPSVLSYVGAFWRAAETGERLIRIPAANSTQTLATEDEGKWMAVVGDDNGGQEWIALDTKASGDAGVWGASFNAVAEGSAAYQVYDGGKLYVSGTATNTDPIYFRIGLKSKLNGGNPAAAPRYGVVYLVYNDYQKVHKIYVRQGEAPDYVMYTGDAEANGAAFAGGRPDAMPWSPYNLTAKTWADEEYSQIKRRDFENGGYVNGTGDSEADFAAYPTMAGAHFQWAQATDATGQQWQRRAFNPGLTTYPVIGWDGGEEDDTSFHTWTGDDKLHETCPEGYRRPDVKIKDDGVDGNEAWQSFVSTQESVRDNSAWGYYADGYFDRLQVEASEGTSANTEPSVVAKGGKDAAYIGRIIFNNSPSSTTHYNASIFVPAAGNRDYLTGALESAGSIGYGWSRLNSSNYFGRYYNINKRSLNPYNAGIKSVGISVRCVYDPDWEPDPEPPVVDPDNPGTQGEIVTYVGAFWKAAHKGERLIHVPISYDNHAGKWAVQVLDKGGFADGDILFQAWDGTLPSSHPANATIDTDALTAGKTVLTGTVAKGGKITFKIGLKTTYTSANGKTASKPARYARIVLSYGNSAGTEYYYNQVIYLRQGEEPDYMIHPNDKTSPMSSYVRQFSAYNLTEATLTDNDDYVTAGSRGGDFVAYPSQAGAMFQWNGVTGRFGGLAWHPTKTYGTNVWVGTADKSSWSSSHFETCPTGYRRPSTTTQMSVTELSEIGQSLTIAYPASNVSRGFYADGYFDRRWTPGATSVESSSHQVAYIGTLFYNPLTGQRKNASIFFPEAGRREGGGVQVSQVDGTYSGDYGSGELEYHAKRGYYWSSFTRTADTDKELGYSLQIRVINSTVAYNFATIGSNAMSIRCVKE